MVLSLDRLPQMLFALLGQRRNGSKTIPRLNLSAMSERDIADLNLPSGVRGRLLGQREAQRIRRGI